VHIPTAAEQCVLQHSIHVQQPRYPVPSWRFQDGRRRQSKQPEPSALHSPPATLPPDKSCAILNNRLLTCV
jgi:hypothetical protein